MKGRSGKRSAGNSADSVKKSERTGLRQERRPIDWGQVMSRVRFYIYSLIILAGCFLVIVQYIQVFSINNEIADLREDLNEIEEDNKVLLSTVMGDTMNMDVLYAYATGSLGMVESTSETIIYVTIANKSYTNSNLPVQDVPESKVTYHWFE